MAQLDVQPKKSSPLIWIVLLVVILALLFFLVKGCNDSATNGTSKTDSTNVAASTVTDQER